MATLPTEKDLSTTSTSESQIPTPHTNTDPSPSSTNAHQQTNLPELPYNLRHHKFTISWVCLIIVLDSCILPIALYYALTFASTTRVGIVFAIITSTTGIVTPLKFFLGLYSYTTDSRYRPHLFPWWKLDFSHSTIAFAWCVMLVILIVGSAPYDPFVNLLCLPPGAFVLCIGLVMAVLQGMYVLGMNLLVHASSFEKGEKVPPGVYFFIEDIVAVEGHGRVEWRDALRRRYEASGEFRRMLSYVSWVWIAGCFGNAVIIGLVTGLVDVQIAYGVGWAVPFIFVAVWTGLTIVLVKMGLRREERAWKERREDKA